ncbi:MAG: arginine--tRNA ligase, partial [Candidatus Eisenbacteria bacterium]|nr:arginine--tRNA ligase [Candidatus Latescibacterota bacterium]MBD3301951.1 arginine--tRNA ligase [Candidatus Eisenbacteria bacterium]
MTALESVSRVLKKELVARLPSAPAEVDPPLSRPPDPSLGDLAVAAFPLAKTLRQPPARIAAEWVERLEPGTALGALRLDRAEAVGGFVNLRFETESLLAAACRAVAEMGDAPAWTTSGAGTKVMVEYSSPNTNKPLHLGHVRNNAIGMALSNLLEACGYEVVRVNLVNDRGIHICKSMLAYRTWGGGETPADTGEKGDHFVGRWYVRYDQALREERAAYLE